MAALLLAILVALTPLECKEQYTTCACVLVNGEYACQGWGRK